MPRVKLTDKQKKKIIADYIENGNMSETARMNNVNVSTVKRLIDSGYDKDLQEKANQKKIENTEEVLEAMKKRKDTKIKILDKIFKAMDNKLENIDMFTNIKDLATAYGIIMDKELKIKELELQNKREENVKDAIANLPALADLIRITPEEKENNK